MRPDPADYAFKLEAALSSVVGLRSLIPADAFTAEVLGTERTGHGVVIREDGLILTIGYLMTEAETIWITKRDGRAVPGHAMAFDQDTGLGLVQALAALDLPALPLGRSATAAVGDRVVLAGAGGLGAAVAARIVARQEFAGYWEYLLENAIFTAPSHPNWGGAALIADGGTLIGIGSLQLQRMVPDRGTEDINMCVPIDLLRPILPDLLKFGRSMRPPRPWLGLYAAETEAGLSIAGLASRGPADKAGLLIGDRVVEVAGKPVDTLARFFRAVWALGRAGAEVPLSVMRDGRKRTITVASSERRKFLKGPVLH